MYNITEIINDTKPIYKISNLPESYNEALLKKKELTMKEKNSLTKNLILSSIKKLSLTVTAYRN